MKPFGYSKAKTMVKGAEAPLLTIVGAVLLQRMVAQFGQTISDAESFAAIVSLYGAWKGFLNWRKNRRRR